MKPNKILVDASISKLGLGWSEKNPAKNRNCEQFWSACKDFSYFPGKLFTFSVRLNKWYLLCQTIPNFQVNVVFYTYTIIDSFTTALKPIYFNYLWTCFLPLLDQDAHRGQGVSFIQHVCSECLPRASRPFGCSSRLQDSPFLPNTWYVPVPLLSRHLIVSC